jgi:hypothetical protein
MDPTKQDEEAAIASGEEFFATLQKVKRPSGELQKTIRNLRRILDGDETAWQYPARNKQEALQFIISNTLTSGYGLKIEGKTDVVTTVANMISEDVDFPPLTEEQRHIKRLVESYGFIVHQIVE